MVGSVPSGRYRRIALVSVCVLVAASLHAQATNTTGPETEKRFPPLKVADGFEAILFACDPLVEYPSVIALGPRQGSVFVAYDYMTGLGTEIVRRDEVRLVQDTDHDGYADKSTLYADGFNSIMGLASRGDALYVMHAPYLTLLRDANGDSQPEERRHLLRGLGLTPAENPVRLHCANGVTVGYDGWLYLALGDHGCDVVRPEGDRLRLEGGGILRCRLDGSDLHVFSRGLRNIYDVALDSDLNVFVRDNENDGGDYMNRVYHSFFGADHGYPYDYYERPHMTLRPLIDVGRGSSAGGVAYLETSFPPAFHSGLIFCEWGRAVVHYPLTQRGSSFGPTTESDLVAGSSLDPYGFRPTSLVVDRDGSLLISDWADGQRPRRGRGRIYRLRHTGSVHDAEQEPSLASTPAATLPEERFERLGAASYHERFAAQLAIEARGDAAIEAVAQALADGSLTTVGELHAVWILTQARGTEALETLLSVAQQTDRSPRVRVAAVRAIADLADPVLVQDRLGARGDGHAVTEKLAALEVAPGDSRLRRELILAFGRIHWPGLPSWLAERMTPDSDATSDDALQHAAMFALRQSKNWSALLRFLDLPRGAPTRRLALQALDGQYSSAVTNGLVERLEAERRGDRQREYTEILARLYKKPGLWKYWGYRPPPRPAHTEAWAGTTSIRAALDATLARCGVDDRVYVLERLVREAVPVRVDQVATWLDAERRADRVLTILSALENQPLSQTREPLHAVVTSTEQEESIRLKALAMLRADWDNTPTSLLKLAMTIEPGAVLVETLRELSRRPQLDSREIVHGHLSSQSAAVRAAAVETLAVLNDVDSGGAALGLLSDPNESVRVAAARALGTLQVTEAADGLLAVALEQSPLLRSAAFESLAKLRDPRVVPLLEGAIKETPGDHSTRLAAVAALGEVGGAEQVGAIVEMARTDRSRTLHAALVSTLDVWSRRDGISVDTRRRIEHGIAKVLGFSGILARWRAFGPMTVTAANDRISDLVSAAQRSSTSETDSGMVIFSRGDEGRLQLQGSSDSATSADENRESEPAPTAWIVMTEVDRGEAASVEFLASSSGGLEVYLNGEKSYVRSRPGRYERYSDRFAAQLAAGVNQIVVVAMESESPSTTLQIQLRERGASERHDRLMTLALTRRGNVDGGREVFFNVEKSQCLKCHRFGDQGSKVGPDLTGVGRRFSRIHLIESILAPSRTIAASFHTETVVMRDGTVINGVKVEEDGDFLTLGDSQGKTHVLIKADIELRERQPVSTMPEGLEKAFTDSEFVDLVAFLLSR